MNQNPDFQPSPKPKGDPSKMVIYFVPLGIDMTKKDISVFRKNAIKFGAKVLLNFPSRKKRSCQTPNVLCISQYCRPAQVAKRLKFKSTEEFQEFLYKVS